jgi:predicted nuclease of predicted toxin-antitoxin system
VKVRFLADADLNQAIVNGVRRSEQSLDFLTASAAGLRALTDLEVLSLASAQQRVLVSHDVGQCQFTFEAFGMMDATAQGYSSSRKASTYSLR